MEIKEGKRREIDFWGEKKKKNPSFNCEKKRVTLPYLSDIGAESAGDFTCLFHVKEGNLLRKNPLKQLHAESALDAGGDQRELRNGVDT